MHTYQFTVIADIQIRTSFRFVLHTEVPPYDYNSSYPTKPEGEYLINEGSQPNYRSLLIFKIKMLIICLGRTTCFVGSIIEVSSGDQNALLQLVQALHCRGFVSAILASVKSTHYHRISV